MTDPLDALQAADEAPRCDHICHLPATHLTDGWCHQYGYEHPSPRINLARLRAAEAVCEAAEPIVAQHHCIDRLGSRPCALCAAFAKYRREVAG